MSRKATSGKLMTADELVVVLSDVVRNLKNGTIERQDANSISSAAKTICHVAKTQMEIKKFQMDNPGTNQGVKFLE
jgi:hypothetical protein